MPTYGYECNDCKNAFETIQSIKDAPLTVCESCGGSLRKKIYPVGIAFKGAGFYVNDYADKKTTTSSESAPAPASPAPTSDATTTPATPVAAAPAPASTPAAAPAATTSSN